MKITGFFVFLLLISQAAFAQPAQDRPYSINGKVVDNGGKPVANARIQALLPYFTFSDGRFPLAYSDENGNFVIGVPRIGTYTMSVVNPATGVPTTSDRFYYPEDNWRPTVVVESGRPSPFVTISITDQYATILGTLLEEGSDRPVPSATFRLCRLKEPNFCSTKRFRGRDGKFDIPVIDGGFSIEIAAFGYDEWFLALPDGLKAGESRQLAVELAKEGSRPVVRGTSLPAPEIVFPRDGSQLFGFPRITTLRWSPVAGSASYAVELEVCEGNRKETGCFGSVPLQTPRFPPTSGIKDTVYEFEFIGTQPGRYRIWAVDSEGRPGKKTPWVVFYYR